MLRPNFLVIGTAKAGTSTLAELFRRHPAVCFASPHEPNFFAFDHEFARGADHYQRCFAHYSNEPWIGEKSWRYGCINYYPNAINRIRQFSPCLKLIFVVRDPFPRALSMWRELRDAGQDLISSNASRAILENGLILDSSRYFQTFNAYADIFGRDNFLLLFFEDFVSDQSAVFDKICQFLTIERFEIADSLHENPSVGQRSDIWVLEALRRLRLDTYARRWSPRPLRNAAHEFLKRPIGDVCISEKARLQFLDLVRDDCLAILKIGGKPSDFWQLS